MIQRLSPRAAARPDYGRSDFAHSPLVVFVELTQACDLVCLHCRACAQTRPDPRELGPAETRLLMDQLAEFPKPPMVVLTGGDPLKRPDIFDLVEYGVGRGLSISITPSATPLATADAIRRLRDSGIARVAVSLDGADAATHDAFRGVEGSYRRTFGILQAARSLGIPLQVNTTVTPANHQQIDAMADQLAEQAIVLWSVFFLVPVGRGNAIPRLSREEYEAAFERLWQNSQRQPYAIKTTEAPHYRRFAALRRKGAHDQTSAAPLPGGYPSLGINDGKGVMFIGHTGRIYPSGFMPIPCGYFPWQHVVEVYQRSPVLVALRDAEKLEGKCGACEFRHLCGGSRARAYAVTGNMFAEEPDCLYQPAAMA
jgi:radical SAM protein